ncbi:hypothetical protein O181_067450 [Austropuccinia psidii MF-1]|uniref:Uncharacterized protein n=1 Tax=Austropuccinia psidii MF-1 TaxID=1389203 RepID=A0A9Q3EZ02_9BASI|nr:hypothetical protein [Austropuccinia psidii MF-1]
MKPKSQAHVMDNPYHQDDIKPGSMFMNKEISPSQYQDGANMSYSEKEALKQLPEASSWPKFSGTGEYDHMEVIDYNEAGHGGRVKSSKSTEMVLGYGRIPFHLKMTNTLWKKIHMSGFSDSLKDLKPLILK